MPPPPRAPLAVRRATPEVPRLRTEQPRAQTLELALDGEPEAPSGVLTPGRRAAGRHVAAATIGAAGRRTRRTPRSSRASVAVAIDLLILAAIDAIVVYFTMQICGVTLEDLGILPKGPLLAFLLVQNGGYLVAFTAGGQTLGKMAAGIRVVPTESASLDLGRAFLRELMWFLLAVPAGLGFVTALLQPRPSRPPRSLRRHARRPRYCMTDGSRDSGFGHQPRILDPSPGPESRIPALLVSTALGVGYIPFAPGTFGSAAGLAALGAAPGIAGRSGRHDRRAVRRRIVERQRRGTAFRPRRSWTGRHRRSDGHADHAVPESGRMGRRVVRASSCFASPTS